MRVRLMGGTSVVCLLLAVLPAWAGAEKATAPSIIVRVKSIEGQLADAEYLAELAGPSDDFKKFMEKYKAKLKGNSLDGIDVSRPLGAYASLGKDLTDSKIVFLLPIADQKTFLDFLKSHEIPMEKDKDGLYTMRVPNAADTGKVWELTVREILKAALKIDVGAMPDPFYVRFANKYAYVAFGKENKELLDPKKLVAVSKMLPASVTSTLAVSLAIDQLPAEGKKQFLGKAEALVEKLKQEKKPEESAATHRLRTAFGAEVETWAKIVGNEASELTLSFDVDRKKSELSLSFGLEGKPGTKLAKAIADLGAGRSVNAGLVGKDSAMSMFMHLSLPEGMRKAWDQYVDEELQKELLKEENKENRALQEAIFKVLQPTLRAAEMDWGMNMRGPSKTGHYAAVMAVKVKDGATVMKTILANLPEKEAKQVELDVAKFGAIRIHKINNLNVEKKNDKIKFGDGPGFFAARDDALMMAFGDGALEALKDALASKPAPSKIYQIEMSLARTQKFLGTDDKAAAEAAKKVFADNPNADRIRMTLEGGKSLRMSYSMSAPVVTYFQMIAKIKMEDLRKPK